jgi:hypothetical protein
MTMRGIFPARDCQLFLQLSRHSFRGFRLLYCSPYPTRGYSTEKMAENGWRLA